MWRRLSKFFGKPPKNVDQNGVKNSLEMLYKKESFRKATVDKEGLMNDEFYQKVCQTGWHGQSNYKNLQCVSSIAPSEGSEWLLDRNGDQHVNSQHEDVPTLDHCKKPGVTSDTYNTIFAIKAKN